MFISITFTETSIDETNKTQQKVRGSKFMFKISTIHANTCILDTVYIYHIRVTTTKPQHKYKHTKQLRVIVEYGCNN